MNLFYGWQSKLQIIELNMIKLVKPVYKLLQN